MAPLRDYYAVLEVDPLAEVDVLRHAYRKLAKRNHPDHPGGSSQRMIAVNQAWAVLRDPTTRAAYDSRRLGAVVSGLAGGPADRQARSRFDPGPLGRRRAAKESSPVDRTSTVLAFGRYAGWSLAELARHDPDYLTWLSTTPAGRSYASDIHRILSRSA